jgi:pilus assembly protein Flp/PilA
MKEAIIAFFKDEDGLTAVEYAIAGSLVVGGAVVAFDQLGTAVTGKIDCLEDAVSAAAPTNC